MRMLGNSVRLRYLELLGEKITFPEDHYQGEYITDIARLLVEEFGDNLKDKTEDEIFKLRAEQAIFDDIKKTIKRLGFKFDIFYTNQYQIAIEGTNKTFSKNGAYEGRTRNLYYAIVVL